VGLRPASPPTDENGWEEYECKRFQTHLSRENVIASLSILLAVMKSPRPRRRKFIASAEVTLPYGAAKNLGGKALARLNTGQDNAAGTVTTVAKDFVPVVSCRTGSRRSRSLTSNDTPLRKMPRLHSKGEAPGHSVLCAGGYSYT